MSTKTTKTTETLKITRTTEAAEARITKTLTREEVTEDEAAPGPTTSTETERTTRQLTEEEAADIAPRSTKMTTRVETRKEVTGDETTVTVGPTTTKFKPGGLALKDHFFFLIDINHSEKDKERMEEILVEHVKDTICVLESTSGRIINKMYIGKTYVDGTDGTTFNCLNHETWDKKGIAKRWSDHKGDGKPTDGMVVLCAFTQDDLPAGSRRSHEYLAVAMEQRLIHHFQIFDTKELPVAVNSSFDQGGISVHTNTTSKLNTCENAHAPPQPAHHASVVYMTFAYRQLLVLEDLDPNELFVLYVLVLLQENNEEEEEEDNEEEEEEEEDNEEEEEEDNEEEEEEDNEEEEEEEEDKEEDKNEEDKDEEEEEDDDKMIKKTMMIMETKKK